VSLIKQLAGETAIYGLGNIFGRIAQFLLLTPYLTNITNKSEYGIHGIMYAYAALLMVLFTYRMETALFRFGTKKEDKNTAFSTASIAIFLSTIIFSILFLLNAKNIAGFLTDAADARFVIYFALIIAFDTLAALPFAKLRLEKKAKRFVIVKLVNVFITIFLTVFLLSGLPKLIESGFTNFEAYYDRALLLDYVFIANLAASFVQLLLLIKEYFGIKFQFDKALFQQMFKYAFPLILVGIAGVINQLLDRILIDKFIDTESSGVYNAVAKIAILMNLFAVAFNYAAEPFFFRHAADRKSKEVYGQVGQTFALVGSLAFLGITLYLDLIRYLIGDQFWIGLKVVPILLLAYFFLGLYYNFSIWYKLSDKTKFGAYIAIGGAIITITLNLVLLPRIGIMGSAWATISCYGFMAIAGYLLGQKYYPIHYPIPRILLYILSAIAAFGLATLLRPNFNENIIYILLCNTFILLLYMIGVYFLEKNKLFKIIK
jgi:O-antigen/teichoic acid export membrane protein